jgi:ABC-type transport system substrate-binding protein/pSer/pThr/pTyr-binding forkhead associated (FHA) protein
MATPTIIFEDGQEMVFSGSERMTIGRAEDNNVIVEDAEMSRHHAEIILHPDGSAEIKDRGSRSGTFVNDQRVESQLLRDGDHLSIGPLHAVFRFKRSAPSTATTRIPLRGDNNAQKELQTAFEALKAKHSEKTDEFAKLEASTKSAQDKLEGIQRETATQETKLTELRRQTSEAETKLQTLTKEIVEARTRLETFTKDEAAAKQRLDQLKQEADAARTRLENFAKDESAAKQRLDQLKQEALAAQQRADEQTKRFESLQQQVRETETKLQQQQATLREGEETLARLQDTTLKTEHLIATLTVQHEQKASALSRITNEADEAQKLLDALSKRQKEDAAQSESVHRQLEEARAESTRLREQARLAEESLSMLQEATAKSEASEKERLATLDALNTQHAQKETALQETQKRLDDLLARENEIAVRLRDIETRNAEKENELSARLASLESDLADKATRLAETQKALQAASSEQTKLQAIKQQLTNAEEQLIAARKRLANETELLEDTMAQREAAESELEEIREQAADVLSQDGTHTIKPKTSRTTITLRLFLILVPFAVLALASWAAEQSRTVRAMRGEGVVAMLTDPKPALHPYAPRTEAERQIIDLVHEPLMRVGGDGTLQPALAELWRWSQDVTCWFADEATAKQAQERLQAQIGESNRWAEWRLSTVRLVTNSLVLNFNDATHADTPKALAVIADLMPQTVAFWRVESQQPLQAIARSFLADSPLAKQVRRVWFDRDNSFEIVTVGPAQRLLDEFRSHLASKVPTEVRITLMGEVSALSEPVLDLDMRQGQTWHDGTPVTAWDVKTTIEQVSRRPWLLPNREALRHIQDMEIQNGGNQLRVVFRSRYGPALCGWAGLPVLPASWWKAHERDDDKAFTLSPPPGAGSFRLAHLDSRTLSLTPVSTQTESPRFLFHFNASPLMTEVGLGTKTTNLVWPATIAGNHDDLLACLTPPHRRLVVVWNTKSPVLADVRTREALAMITDVASITTALPGKHTISDGSLFPPGMWLHTKAPRVPWSAAKAKRALADAGWLPGVDGIGRNAGRKFEFSLLLVTGDPVVTQTANLLAAQWRELGASIRVETLESADLLAGRLASREFDAVMLEQRFEVSWDQFPWWHSSQAKPGGTNFAGIEDPQTDLLLEALATEFEPASAAERVRQLEGRLLPLQAMLPLFHTVDHAAVSAALAANKPRSSWTLRELAFKPKTPSRTPSSLELKLPDE